MTHFYKIKTFVIDDEQAVLDDVVDELTESGIFEVTGSFTNLAAATQAARKNGQPDFVLSDIHMNGLSGLLATKLFKDEFVVLMTGHPESSEAACRAYPAGCIYKPISIDSLMPLVDRFYGQHKPKPIEIAGGNLMVKDTKEGGHRPVPVHEITYIQSFGDYADIYSATKHWTTHSTMKGMARILVDSGKFMRISNQHIVAYDKICRVENKQVYVLGHEDPLTVKGMGESAFEAYLRNVRPEEYKKKSGKKLWKDGGKSG